MGKNISLDIDARGDFDELESVLPRRNTQRSVTNRHGLPVLCREASAEGDLLDRVDEFGLRPS